MLIAVSLGELESDIEDVVSNGIVAAQCNVGAQRHVVSDTRIWYQIRG